MCIRDRSYTTADFNTVGSTISWGGSNVSRRLTQGGSATWLKAFCVGSNNSGSPDGTFTIAGSGASTADYPVWCAYNSLSSGRAAGTFSFSDSTSSGTQDPHGWDDFQDGSGMGNGWVVETLNDRSTQGLPSLVALQ